MKTNNGHWPRILVLAACACLIVACVFVAYTLRDSDNPRVTVYVPDKKVVSYYDAVDAISGSYSYPAADQGDWFCTVPLEAVLRKYEGQDVLYFVGIYIYNYPLLKFEDSDEEKAEKRNNLVLIQVEEFNRLTKLGYKVGLLVQLFSTAEGGTNARFFAGYLTAEQINNFQPHEDCGYMFYLINDKSMNPYGGIITAY